MSSAIQKLSAAAETTGLSFDRERNILYGTFGAYAFAVLVNASNVRYCSIFFHVTRDGNAFIANDGKQIAKESNKLVQFVKPAGAAPRPGMLSVWEIRTRGSFPSPWRTRAPPCRRR